MENEKREMHFYELKAILKGLEMFINLWNQENFEKVDNRGFMISFCYNQISYEGDIGTTIKDLDLDIRY